MDLLQVLNISKAQSGNLVVQEVSFTQQPFQKLAIVGESGSGKSTLLKMIGGLIQPDSGDVLFENKHVDGPNEKLIPGHPKIAYLSQHFELRNNYRVEEILEYANMLPDEEAQNLYSICRISHLLKRKTDQLSGGEKQRIAMARLLIGAPKLFLLDEPFSNLDVLHRNILRSVIRDMGEKLGISCLLVSHDPVDTLSWADEIIVLRNGQIVQQATPEQVYHQPANEYVAGLFGNYNLLTPAQATQFSTKKTIIRPEAFKLSNRKNKGSLAGKVQAIYFHGSFYEIEVTLPDALITARTVQNTFTKGDTVYVSLQS